MSKKNYDDDPFAKYDVYFEKSEERYITEEEKKEEKEKKANKSLYETYIRKEKAKKNDNPKKKANQLIGAIVISVLVFSLITLVDLPTGPFLVVLAFIVISSFSKYSKK
ncbi:MAG: hypothetical protein IH571_04785 [Acholeplasmataceae bacterium]|nr:hypothetical protein [Acholeplasmataceae bacterium]